MEYGKKAYDSSVDYALPGRAIEAMPETTLHSDLEHIAKMAADLEIGLDVLQYQVAGESQDGKPSDASQQPNTLPYKFSLIIGSLSRAISYKNRIVAKIGQ